MQRLVIHRPIRSSKISQGWGENKACVGAAGKISSTKSGTCPVGTTPFYQSVGLRGHNGLDLPAIHGEPVLHGATYDGWMKIEKDEQGGIGVDVVSNEPLKVGEKTSYVKMRYWHLKTPIGWDKKPVRYGQMIGLADNTGASSGDHLHWSPKWCDKHGNSIEQSNGYFGAFDPTPYYTHDIFSGDTAASIGMPIELTTQERKELSSQLSILRRLLLGIREIIYKL